MLPAIIFAQRSPLVIISDNSVVTDYYIAPIIITSIEERIDSSYIGENLNKTDSVFGVYRIIRLDREKINLLDSFLINKYPKRDSLVKIRGLRSFQIDYHIGKILYQRIQVGSPNEIIRYFECFNDFVVRNNISSELSNFLQEIITIEGG